MAKNSGVFRGWHVVAGSGVGIAFGSIVFTSGAFAQLANAWVHEFGWTQPQLAKAATICLLLQMLTFPVFGWLLDRWGSRKVACASIVLFALALLALSRIGDSLNQLYAAFALIGLVSGGTNVVSYARALSLWFDRKRGLALGLAAGSQAIGAVLLPILGAKIIAAAGWSTALVNLAALELLVCLPLVALLVRDSPAPYGLLPDGAASAGQAASAEALVSGLSRGAVLRSPTFWKLAFAFAVMGLSVYAITINIVFILSKTAGLAPAEIAEIQAIAGAAVLIGRVGFGWLLDRLHAPWVGMLTLAMGATGIALYAATTDPTLILLSALLGGAAIGGEADLMPYLASRYFGTRSLSSVFGWFLAAFSIGAAIGPIAFATIATAHDSVVLPLYLLIALHIVPALAFVTLGRYPSVAELAAATSARSRPTATAASPATRG